jgi:hypothetical protein
MLACGLSLNLTSEGVMLIICTGYPLNPIPVGRLILWVPNWVPIKYCRFRKIGSETIPIKVPMKMTVPINGPD